MRWTTAPAHVNIILVSLLHIARYLLHCSVLFIIAFETSFLFFKLKRGRLKFYLKFPRIFEIFPIKKNFFFLYEGIHKTFNWKYFATSITLNLHRLTLFLIFREIAFPKQEQPFCADLTALSQYSMDVENVLSCLSKYDQCRFLKRCIAIS